MSAVVYDLTGEWDEWVHEALTDLTKDGKFPIGYNIFTTVGVDDAGNQMVVWCCTLVAESPVVGERCGTTVIVQSGTPDRESVVNALTGGLMDVGAQRAAALQL